MYMKQVMILKFTYFLALEIRTLQLALVNVFLSDIFYLQALLKDILGT